MDKLSYLNDQIFPSITADLHSLFELIPGSSDWLCISTFDLISFLVQQLLPILLWPADLADPGSWKESNHMDWPLGGGLSIQKGHTVCLFPTFPLIETAGRNPTDAQ